MDSFRNKVPSPPPPPPPKKKKRGERIKGENHNKKAKKRRKVFGAPRGHWRTTKPIRLPRTRSLQAQGRTKRSILLWFQKKKTLTNLSPSKANTKETCFLSSYVFSSKKKKGTKTFLNFQKIENTKPGRKRKHPFEQDPSVKIETTMAVTL